MKLTIPEFRLGDGNEWHPMSDLERMRRVDRNCVLDFLAAQPKHRRDRPATKRELAVRWQAWQAGRSA